MTPDLQPSSTANVNARQWLRGGWKTTTPQTAFGFSSRGSLPASGRLFCHWLEGFGLELSVLLQQNLNFSFRLFQFFPTGGRKLNALFKEGERLLQLDLTFLQLLDYLFQALKTLFKFGQRGFAPCLYFNATNSGSCPVFFVRMIKKIVCEAFRNGTEAHEVSFVTIV